MGSDRAVKPSSGLKLAIAAVVGFTLLGAVSAGVYALSSHDAPFGPTARGELSKLNRAGLSTKDLKQVDKQKLFMEVVRNILRQRIIHTRSISVRSEKPDFSDADVTRVDAGFDYDTKKMGYEKERELQSSRGGTAQNPPDTRCINGKYYVYTTNGTWRETPDSDCKNGASVASLIGDGLIPGGLTRAQTDKFIDYFMNDYPDFIKVHELNLHRGDRKTYLRFVVDYTPVATGSYGYIGLQHFAWAFARTDAKGDKHPYVPKGVGTQGEHVIYYVDPATGLPVYSQMSNIAPIGENGKPLPNRESNLDYANERYEYFFDKIPQFDQNANNSVGISFPEEKPGDKPKSAEDR